MKITLAIGLVYTQRMHSVGVSAEEPTEAHRKIIIMNSCCASYWKVYGSGFDKQKNTQKDEETRLRSDRSVGSCSAQNTSDD